ncbi:MAG: hypothetical protein IT442_14520, partial [Phycisphaeraceae bacterium]|nr:hypothetical protein [Phycisphaeraceae bacterium]
MHFAAIQLCLAASGSWLMELIPLLGIVLLVAGLVMMYRSRRQRSMAPRITPQEQVERWRQEKGLRGDLEELMVEIEQLAKRMAAQLDAKAVRIEQLLEEADQKVAALESAAGNPPTPRAAAPEPSSAPMTQAAAPPATDGPAQTSAPGATPEPEPVAAPGGIQRPNAPVGPIRVKTRPTTTVTPTPTSTQAQKIVEQFTSQPTPPPAAPARTPAPAMAAATAGSDKPSLSRSVYQLADQNLSAEQIARQLG